MNEYPHTKKILVWRPDSASIVEVSIPNDDTDIKEAVYERAKNRFPGYQPHGFLHQNIEHCHGIVRMNKVSPPIVKSSKMNHRLVKGKVVNNSFSIGGRRRKNDRVLEVSASSATAENRFRTRIAKGAAPFIVNLNLSVPQINEVVRLYKSKRNHQEAPREPEKAKLWSALQEIKAQDIQDDDKLLSELSRHMLQQEIKETMRPFMAKQEEVMKQQQETAKQQQETAKKLDVLQEKQESLLNAMQDLIKAPRVEPERPQE